jgi:hypothetical protein
MHAACPCPARYLLLFTAAVVVAALLLATGCSTVADGSWQEPRTENAPFDEVLVVAVVSQRRMRSDIERRLSDEIETRGSRATASVNIEARLAHEAKSPESVIAMIEDTGADAVVVVRWVEQTVEAHQSQSKAYVDIGPQITVIEDPHVTEVWYSDYTIHETATQLEATSDTKVQALVYDVADGARLVYKVDVETKYEENGSDSTFVIADNIAIAVAKQLHHAGLVR